MNPVGASCWRGLGRGAGDAGFDRLRAEGERYARRLHDAGALVEHYDVPRADHGYDMNDTGKARRTYTLIARRVRQAVPPAAPAPTDPATD